MNIFISHKTLSRYIEKMPEPEALSRIFLEHICEVEGLEQKNGDTIFELKITPDRGHLLSYLGLAREVSVFSDAKLVSQKSKVKGSLRPLLRPRRESADSEFANSKLNKNTKLIVEVREPKACQRYIGRVVEGVDGRESPPWLKEALEACGQRSINAIVDVTNFVMLEVGQPMHAFDADKLSREDDGGIKIVARNSEEGEKIETLDGKNIVLPIGTLVIADSIRALAIAGVKGGAYAGVGENVNTIVLESATFDSAMVRKASAGVNIRTDSSRRYEHNRTPEIALQAMERATELLLEIFPDAKAGEIVDVYPRKDNPHNVSISPSDISRILGIPYTSDNLSKDLSRLGFEYKATEGEGFLVTAPAERFDIRIGADIAEEVVRLIGYDNIPTSTLSDDGFNAIHNNTYDAMIRVRNALALLGFSEIFTYAFRKEGKVEVANPMAEGVNFLRDNLSYGMNEALVFNARNAPLLGVDEILMFEIGTVFLSPEREEIHISLGAIVTKAMKQSKKEEHEREVLESAQAALESALNIKLSWSKNGKASECLLSFSTNINKKYEPLLLSHIRVGYKRISAYPFMLRDIAMWASGGISQDEILSIIRTEGGELLVRDRLFDVFEKDGKKSYAFNLVFQSHERTLSDLEINEVMARITKKLTARGLEVR